MFKKILVPLDGSMRSEQAIPIAARVARACEGSVVLLKVVHPLIGSETYMPGRAQGPLGATKLRIELPPRRKWRKILSGL